MNVSRSLVCLLAFLALALPATATAAPAPETMSGAWTIDVDATLGENANWHEAYNAAGVEARASIRAGWEKRTLVIDLTGRLITQQAQGGKLSRFTITDMRPDGDVLRMTATAKDGAPLAISLAFAGPDRLRFVMETEPPIVLKRATAGAAHS